MNKWGGGGGVGGKAAPSVNACLSDIGCGIIYIPRLQRRDVGGRRFAHIGDVSLGSSV